jgi:peptidoglycan/xylan/chitin deacetylase (PgdA/CDA1 family)
MWFINVFKARLFEMKDKRKIITIVIFLVCILIASGYYIWRQSPVPSAVIPKDDIKIDTSIKESEVSIIETPEQDETINKLPTDVASAKNLVLDDRGIPVLMYHSISYEKGNTARVTKENFIKQMNYLKDNNYVTLTLDEAYNFLANDIPMPEKSLVLTFDDGYLDNYVDAFPILKEFGFKATIFVITGTVDKNPSYMKLEQLKEMLAHGIDIQSHTTLHENLKDLSYEKQVKTLKESKAFLEKSLNKEVDYFAYPYGAYAKETLNALKEAGYTMAFTTDGRWSDKGDGILTLDRVFISGAATLEVFIDRITNPIYKF